MKINIRYPNYPKLYVYPTSRVFSTNTVKYRMPQEIFQRINTFNQNNKIKTIKQAIQTLNNYEFLKFAYLIFTYLGNLLSIENKFKLIETTN